MANPLRIVPLRHPVEPFANDAVSTPILVPHAFVVGEGATPVVALQYFVALNTVFHLIFAGVHIHNRKVQVFPTGGQCKGGELQQQCPLFNLQLVRIWCGCKYRGKGFNTAIDGDAALALDVVKFRAAHIVQGKRSERDQTFAGGCCPDISDAGPYFTSLTCSPDKRR